MNPDLARLVRVTTANLMQQTVEDFCKRICELDASGGFTSFLFNPKTGCCQLLSTNGCSVCAYQSPSPPREVLKGPECVIIVKRQGTVQESVG